MTVLHALNLIAAEGSTEYTVEHVEQLIDYMCTNPTNDVRYHASDMILNIHLNVLIIPVSWPREKTNKRLCFLGSIPREGTPIKLNGHIAITCVILKLIAASAAETELGAMFLDMQEARRL